MLPRFDLHQIQDHGAVHLENSQGGYPMPMETIVVVCLITAAFASFAIVLEWASRKTQEL
jgi:hypothetical protein